jgi:hypothetical protein
MNPPFENGQDLAHVRHAYGFVRNGGALVAIMGAGVKFRQDRRYADFRTWAEDRGAVWQDIPAGAFAESSTGVASVRLVIRKQFALKEGENLRPAAPAPAVQESRDAQLVRLRLASPKRSSRPQAGPLDLPLFGAAMQPALL